MEKKIHGSMGVSGRISSKVKLWRSRLVMQPRAKSFYLIVIQIQTILKRRDRRLRNLYNSGKMIGVHRIENNLTDNI